MKRAPLRSWPTVFLLLWFVLLANAAGEEDYRARLKNAQGSHDEKLTQQVLDAWKNARPDDPEYYIAAANRAYNRDHGVVISTKPPAAGNFGLSDQKTGQPVGSISAAGPTAQDYQEAIDLLKEGLQKAPLRIDIHLGLATLYEESGDPEMTVKTLAAMAACAKAHPNALLYKDGAPYPQPEHERLGLAISNFADRYFHRETKAGDKAFHDLAFLDADTFPDQEYGYNLLGVYYTVIDVNPERALSSYQSALKIVPDDSLVWINIGQLHLRNKNEKAAAKAFHKVVDLGNDPGCVKQAEAELAKLK